MENIAKHNPFTSFVQMLDRLPDNEACRQYLEQILWNGTPTCAHCGVVDEKAYRLKKAGQYKCRSCQMRFTVTIGTMFEGSHLPLRKWFIAIYIFSSHKKGISSHQLAKDLGITQKSAWFMLGRIRYAFKVKSLTPQMTGLVQADETFVGGKNKNRHEDKKVHDSQGRSTKDKTPVFGMVQNGSKVYTQVVPDTKAKTLKPIIEKMVSDGAIVVTDEWLGYSGLNKTHAHVVMNHKAKEYVRGGFHTNGIENFWSHLKRGIYGIYHHASPKHLHRYCDEFTFRYNSRNAGEVERFDVSLAQTNNFRLTYKQLIAN
jgi:transposase-like protein